MSDEIKKTVPVLSGHAVEEIFLRWSEWTSELGEAISRKNIDGFVGEIHAVLEARAGEAVAEVVQWVNFQHRPCFDIRVFDKKLKDGTKLYTHPPIGDAAGKDSVDAARYRFLKSIPFGPGEPFVYHGVSFTFAVPLGKPGFVSSCRGDQMDAAIDSAIASLTKPATGEKA